MAMDWKPKPTTLSGYILRLALRVAVGSPAEFLALCEHAGVDPSLLEDPEARIPMGRALILLREAERRSPDPNLGLKIGREIALSHSGGNVLLGMMANCPTVGTALEKFFIYHDVMADAVKPKMECLGDRVFLFWEVVPPQLGSPRPVAEALLTLFTLVISLLTEGAFKPLEVRFAHPRPPDPREHEEVFGPALRFEQARNELVLDQVWLPAPLRMASPGLCETLEQFADRMLGRVRGRSEWADRVTARVGQRLVKGLPTDLSAVARDLGVSGRSLQNRLREEDVTFRELCEQIRRETAEQRLAQGSDTLCDIAFLLGFSDQSAFHHAFRRWTGMTPKEFRRRKTTLGRTTVRRR